MTRDQAAANKLHVIQVQHPLVEAVMQIFAPFMERNLAVFEKWRASRKQETKA